MPSGLRPVLNISADLWLKYIHFRYHRAYIRTVPPTRGTGTCTQFLYIHGVFFNQFSYTQLAYINKLSSSRVNMGFVTMWHIPKS